MAMGKVLGNDGLLGGAAAFSPLSIAGLQLWLKADAIVGLNDGDPVGTWSDSSEQGNDATQATASKKPTYKVNIQNGLPSVRFDGTDDYFDISGSMSWVQTFTLFIVAQKTRANDEYGTVLGHNNDYHHVEFYGNGSGTIRWFTNKVSSGGHFLISPTISFSQFCLLSLQQTHISGYVVDKSMWINGENVANASGVDGASAELDHMGAQYLGYTQEYFGGDIAEILVFDSALSVGNRQAVENFLNAKWAVY